MTNYLKVKNLKAMKLSGIYPIRELMIISVIMIFLFSCKKDTIKVKSADFSINQDKAYIYEPIYFRANDTVGLSNYKWDFGDGETEVTGFNPSHKYFKYGNYTVTLSINNYTTSKTIVIKPGSISYQIKNDCKLNIDFESYVDNPEDYGSYRKQLSSGEISDTIYSKGIFTGGGNNDLLGIDIFINGTEYVKNQITWAECLHHHIIHLTDTTLFIKKYNQQPGKDSIILGNQ